MREGSWPRIATACARSSSCSTTTAAASSTISRWRASRRATRSCSSRRTAWTSAPIVEAYGARAVRIAEPAALGGAIAEALCGSRTTVLHVTIDRAHSLAAHRRAWRRAAAQPGARGMTLATAVWGAGPPLVLRARLHGLDRHLGAGAQLARAPATASSPSTFRDTADRPPRHARGGFRTSCTRS